MVLTAAEKQKRYRERMRANNPEKFEEAKLKNAARNKTRKKIGECTEKEKEILRQQWRNRKNRINNKLEDVAENRRINHADNKALLAERKKYQRHLAIVKNDYETKIGNMSKNITALKKKCYRLIKKQQSLIACIEELKAKNTELLSNNVLNTVQYNNEMTPISKTESFIDKNIPNISTPEKEKVKKQLLNYNVLSSAVQDTYKQLKSNKDRNILKSIVENDIVKKYKSQSLTTTVLGLKGRARYRVNTLRKNNMIIDEIKQFYEKDDVSRATAGKNEVKTLKKKKQQRRYLLKSLKDLYKKYRLEGGKAKYTSFKKYRPFYVLRPKLSNRETCGCIKHENIMIKIEKLKKMGIIDTKDLDAILSEVQCDLNSKECAYGECNDCKNKLLISFNWDSHSQNEIVTYEEFKLEKYEYMNKKNNELVITNKMGKKQTSEPLETLVEKFNKDINIIKKHVYNMKHQYYQYSTCIKNLKNDEVAVHIDFSENYTCKLATEVQSMHFGGAKPQITIHTGVLYSGNGNKPQAFASVSPNNEHGPEAIWAHLEPILKHIRTEYPGVTGLHFFSDGPSSQYKQKKNFYLFSKMTKLLGFPHSSWNFSEASHGKGAADGVGGAIKRRLDDNVSQGTDIPNAETAFKVLQDSGTSIMTFYISDTDIAKYSISETLTPVPQTMALHQITNTETDNNIKFRCLSCFCSDMLSPRGYCGCLDVKNHLLVQNIESEKENEIENNPDLKNKVKRVTKRTMKMPELSDMSNLEQEQEENRNKVKKICKTVKNKNKTKVTVLADVKYKSDNRSFYNKTFGNYYSPLKLTKIQISDTLNIANKVNINIDNPIPSTSGLCGRQNITQTANFFRRTQSVTDSDASSTENDDEFSVHDTSDDEIFIPEYDSFSTYTEELEENTEKEKDKEIKFEQSHGDTANNKVEEKSKICSKVQFEKTEMITNTDKDHDLLDTEQEKHFSVDGSVLVPNDDYFLVNTETKTMNKEDMELKRLNSIGEIETVEEKSGNCNKIQFKKLDIITNIGIDRELPDDTEEEKHYSIGDSVLVRYFQRQSWKYYVGFIESVEVAETVGYTVRFLKTNYKPTLKFVPTKRDRDVVPQISVVKKIELESHGKAYLLKDFISDQIYFESR